MHANGVIVIEAAAWGPEIAGSLGKKGAIEGVDPVALELLVDACHLAISRATSAAIQSPARQVGSNIVHIVRLPAMRLRLVGCQSGARPEKLYANSMHHRCTCDEMLYDFEAHRQASRWHAQCRHASLRCVRAS